MSATPWTPGPWSVTQGYGEGSVNIMASGNELKVDGRSNRAKANRALLAAAPEMAEALACLANMARHFPATQTYGNRPRTGNIYTVADAAGEASITVEDLHRAATLLFRIRGDAT